MKTKLMLVIAAILTLAGCTQFPKGASKTWEHDGNYSVFTTHYESKDAKSDGKKLTIGEWTGEVKVLGGYGVKDHATGLEIEVKDAK